MKARGSIIRLKLFQIREKKRQMAQLDTMIHEFSRITAELDAQIVSEERKSGISDISHFAYPTFAKAARQRRENLVASIQDLLTQKNNCEVELRDMDIELHNLENQLHSLKNGERQAKTMAKRRLHG